MDVFHEYGNDLVISPTGDLQSVDGEQLTNQRIIRRLLTTPITVTNPPDYIDNPTYGAGLPQFIGKIQTPDILEQITGLITSQMFLEEAVSQTPPPTITISGLPNQLNCIINYTNALTNSQAVLALSIPSTPANFNQVIPAPISSS